MRYTKADFFALLAPVVLQVRREGSPLLPSVRLAQSWLETGGNLNSWNNLGGYKVGSGAPNAYWTGEMVSKGTWEIYGGKAVNVVASFRAYDSVYSFYKDQDLLLARSRYAPVRAATTPAGQCWAFYMCGYATDPDYAAKLISIIKLNGLIQYDETGIVEEEDEEMTKEEKAAFEELKAKVAELAGRQSMDTIPEWAMEAAVAAKKAGIVDTTAGGSYDFYRVLTILHRKGLI